MFLEGVLLFFSLGAYGFLSLQLTTINQRDLSGGHEVRTLVGRLASRRLLTSVCNCEAYQQGGARAVTFVGRSGIYGEGGRCGAVRCIAIRCHEEPSEYVEEALQGDGDVAENEEVCCWCRASEKGLRGRVWWVW